MRPSVSSTGRSRRSVLAIPAVTSIPEGKDEGRGEDPPKNRRGGAPHSQQIDRSTNARRTHLTNAEIRSYVREFLSRGDKEESTRELVPVNKENKRKISRLFTPKQRSHSRIAKLRRSACSLKVLSPTIPGKSSHSPPSLANGFLENAASSDSSNINKSPSVSAAVIRNTLLGNAAIEARKNDFAALKKQSRIKKRPSIRFRKRHRVEENLDEKSYPDSASSSEEAAAHAPTPATAFAKSRPTLPPKRKKRLERARSLRDSNDQHHAFSQRNSTNNKNTPPCFVFQHPEATYVVTKVPKLEEGSDASTSSSERPRSPWWKKAFNLQRRASRAVSESRRNADWWTCPLEDPFADEKKAPLPSSLPPRWDPEVSAVFAAVSRIAARRPRQGTSPLPGSQTNRRTRRSWSPQREPRDRGLGYRDHPRSPTELACGASTSSSRQGAEDRGTSPRPQPANHDKAVGRVSENRGTSPLVPFYTLDKGNSAQELWKDTRAQNLEDAMKVIAKVKEVHVPEEISVYSTSGMRRFSESVYSTSPPQKPPIDKGIFVSEKAESTKSCEGWSSHSIVIPSEDNTNNNKCANALLSCRQFWPTPTPFDILETKFTPAVELEESTGYGEEDDDDLDDTNSTSELNEESYGANSVTMPSNSTHGTTTGVSSETLSQISDSSRHNQWNFEQDSTTNKEKDGGKAEKSKKGKNKESEEDPKVGAEGVRKRLFGNMWLRTSWQLPQEKFLAAKESVEGMQWQATFEPREPRLHLIKGKGKHKEHRKSSLSTEKIPNLKTKNGTLKKRPSQPSGPATTLTRRSRRLHVTGCPGACGGNKRHGGCVLRKHTPAI